MTGSDSDPPDRIPEIRLQFTEEIDAQESIIASDGGLAEWLRDNFADGLRTVGAYADHTFEFLYADPVIHEQYTQQELTATGDEFLLSGRKEDVYQEHLFNLGDFTYDVRGFEDGQVIRIPLEESRGLIISFDGSVTISLPQFVDRLKRQHDIVFQ